MSDYFTKWYEEFPLKKSNENVIGEFLEHTLLPHFGVPLHLISNNSPTFISHNFASFCEKFHINHSFFSSYYPQGNGLAESKNKQLIKIIKKVISNNPHQLHNLLTYVLWADRTTKKIATSVTPFKLVYG